MKKTQIIELFANIKNTFVSFFSITMFIALAVALFTGVSWSSTALLQDVDEELDTYMAKDLDIFFPYGLNQDDLDQIKEIEGVDEVEGSYFTYQFFFKDNTNYQVKLMAITDTLSQFTSIEGDIPSKVGEIALEKTWAQDHGLSIGDTIQFSEDDQGNSRLLNKLLDFDVNTDDFSSLMVDENVPTGMAYLKGNTYTITALVDNIEYLSTNTTSYGVSASNSLHINCIMYTPIASFDETAFTGYTEVLIGSDSLRQLDSFSDEYISQLNDLQDRVSDVAIELAAKKCSYIHDSVDEISDSAQEKLDKAKKQLEDALKQIEDGKKQLENGKIQISNYESMILNGKYSLYNYQAQVNSGWAQLNAAKSTLASYEALYNQKQAEYNNYLNLYNTYASQIEDKFALFDEFIRLYNAYLASIDNANKAFENGEIKTFQEWSDMQRDSFVALEDFATNNISQLDSLRDPLEKLLAELEGSDQYTSEQAQELIKAIKLYLENFPTGFFSDLVHNISDIYAGFEPADELSQIIIDTVLSRITKNVQPYVDKASAMEASAKNILAQAKALLDYYGAQLSSASSQLESARQKISDTEAQLNAYQAQIDEGWNTLNSYQNLLNQKKKELSQGQSLLESAIQQYQDGQKQYQDGVSQLSSFNEKTQILVDYGCTITSRLSNIGYAYAQVLAKIFSQLRLSMAALFLIVGLLVCYSCVSRIVFDQIIRIGTKKALGLRQSEIVLSYLSYTGFTLIVGCILGVVGGFIVEGILLHALKSVFILSEIKSHLYFLEIAMICGLEIVLINAVCWFACRSILKRSAVKLLQGQEPPKGKERFYEKLFFVKKMSLFNRTIINNTFNDRRRVIGTLIGIAGCTALIVTAFTVNDNIMNSFDKQYQDYYHFDSEITFDATAEKASDDIEKILDKYGVTYSLVEQTVGAITAPDDSLFATVLIVPDDIHFFNKVCTMETTDGSDTEYSGGVWLSNAYQNKYKTNPSDTVNAMFISGQQATFAVDEYYVLYIPDERMVMDKDTYETYSQSDYSPNTYLFDSSGIDLDAMLKEINEVDGYIGYLDYYTQTKYAFNTFSSVSKILVIVYVVLSVLMAILVLLNILSMFVDEKKKELIVLMINGFSVKDAKRYIYTDTIYLTIIGILLGLILGTYMGNYAVSSFESRFSIFIHGIDWLAIGIGSAGSLVLTTIMSFISLRKVSKFKLTDINK